MKVQHFTKSEVKFFEDMTSQKYADLPEGTQAISSTLCLVLMRKYYKKRLKDLKWWKRLLTFGLFLSLLSCHCIPQIPTQALYADANCQAILPDYTAIIQVRDNCGIAHIFQEPFPGTILDADNKQVEVIITAVDSSNNVSYMNFDCIILDTIPPAMDVPETMLSYTWEERYHLLSTWQHDTENKIRLSDSTFKVAGRTLACFLSPGHRYWATYWDKDTYWIASDSAYNALPQTVFKVHINATDK